MTPTLERLVQYIKHKRLDAVLLCSSEHLMSYNVKYVSGFSGSEAAVLITPEERHLITDGRYELQASQEAMGYKIHVARDKIRALARLLRKGKLCRIAIESSRVTHELITELERKVPELIVHAIDKKFLNNFRIVKTQAEIECIKEAAEIASAACRCIVNQGLIGKTELQVAGQLELMFRSLGGCGPSFSTIVASGPRSALPHAVPTAREIARGDQIVLDFGCIIGGYNSDETVTCVAGAQPTSLQKRMHSVVKEAQLRAIESLRVGVALRAVDGVARKCIVDAGFGKCFVHALGHGVGLEVHEPPWVSPNGKEILEEGMVITIEPGVYIDRIGGLRLESLIEMRGDGPVILSQMPKNLILVD